MNPAAKNALDGNAVRIDKLRTIDDRLPIDNKGTCRDATGAGFLHR
jgi:hypothetical protein